MSLLLEALQKAARSREQTADREPPPADPPKAEVVAETFGPMEPAAAAGELTLEPTAQGEPLLDEDAFGDDIGADLATGPTPDQAATVVRAAHSREPSAFIRTIDTLRDRPLYGVLAAAVLFVIGGSVYLYIQIANPGLLVRTPPPPEPIARAPEAMPAPKPAVQAPAPIHTAPAAPVAPAVVDSSTAAAAPATTVETAPVTSVRTVPPPAEKAASLESVQTRAPTERSSAIDVSAMRKAEEAINAPPRKSKPAPARVGSGSVKVVHADDQVATHIAPDHTVRANSSAAGNVPPELLEAYQALQEGRFDQAEVLYKKVAQAYPRSIDALLGLGAIAWQKGNAESAAISYQHVLELDPNQPTAQGALISMMGRGDPQASEARLRQLLTREPSAFLYFALGTLHAEQGSWPAAQQAYFQAYQMQPDSPDYAFNLAVGLEHVGQQKTALVYYRKALDLSFKKGRANFDQSLAIERVGLLSARLQ